MVNELDTYSYWPDYPQRKDFIYSHPVGYSIKALSNLGV
jgi:hypothetical protein